ncbi:MAG: hypothetical protein ACMUIU_15795 [bacterium]
MIEPGVMREYNQKNNSRTLFLQLSWFPSSLEGCGPGAAKGQDVLRPSPTTSWLLIIAPILISCRQCRQMKRVHLIHELNKLGPFFTAFLGGSGA